MSDPKSCTPKEADATTSIHAPYDPKYCSETVAAIEDVMVEIRKHLKRANNDQPLTAIDPAALAKAIGVQNYKFTDQ